MPWYDETHRPALDSVEAAVNGFIRGKADVVRVAVTCLLAEGHLLLEDVPGVGKTSLARALASSLGVDWTRIQFTPDLLPGDVTGVSVFHQDTNEFVFHPGPVFANIVLADEINRAAPRTQSALLEVMEEHQVTVDGHPHLVPDPFIVIATENPVEMDGTYPLPEAQLDRFLMKTTIGYPHQRAEFEILKGAHEGHRVSDVTQVATADDVRGLINSARRVHVADAILDYIAELVATTRTMNELALGSSPRGGLGLLRASRVWAATNGRDHVLPMDVQAMARPVLAHRLILAPTFTASGGTAHEAVDRVVASVQVPPTAALK